MSSTGHPGCGPTPFPNIFNSCQHTDLGGLGMGAQTLLGTDSEDRTCPEPPSLCRTKLCPRTCFLWSRGHTRGRSPPAAPRGAESHAPGAGRGPSTGPGAEGGTRPACPCRIAGGAGIGALCAWRGRVGLCMTNLSPALFYSISSDFMPLTFLLHSVNLSE